MAIEHSSAQQAPFSPADLLRFAQTCRRLSYSPRADILFLFPERLEPGYTVELGDCRAYRVSFDKQRLIALEIHNFEAVILPLHPQMARAWKEYTNPIRRVIHMRDRAKRFLLDKVPTLISGQSDSGPQHFAPA